MARRIASAIGIIVLLALALSLLWRVYVHHTKAEPYDEETGAVVKIALEAA
ncbi:MAG TPA: hypothetical protein VNA69_09070 [Thermoanaerobaculia bacterium]|nr:hypothetical protein [Thermoanaerobaculia bacterium]